MTAMTTALIDAYFAKPPTRDWLPIFNDDGTDRLVLACHIADAPNRKGLTTEELPYFNPKTINADLSIPSVERDWAASGIGLEADMAKTIYVDGVAKRLRGDKSEWRLKQQHLRREEQLFRARNFRPNKVDAKPSDYLTDEDKKRFIELAKEVMANMCHLATFLPFTQIKGPRYAQRLLELVERELVTDEEAGRKVTREIEAEYRALGGGVEEITNTQIERLQRRRNGLRFQWYLDQLLFKAWREQYDEVCGEHEALASSLPGVEFDGKTWDYVSLRDRVERRKKLAKETEKAVQVQLAMLKGSTEQNYYKWLAGKTGYKPRNSGYFNAARPEVAQPIYEADFGDEDE